MKGIAKSAELTERVALYRDQGILINKMSLKPNLTKAYLECYLSHSFPVVTRFGTALHPAVIAKSWETMQHGIFDLAHLIVAYNPEETPRDRMLGTVVGVEFPETPKGGWKVQASKAAAPCIRAVSVIHRQLEQAEEIIQFQEQGKMKWTVSMEHRYNIEECGFIVQGTSGVEKFSKSTPEDLKRLGYTYIPYKESPEGLLACFEEKEAKIVESFEGQTTVMLLGGTEGTLLYMGIGLTPIGKEKEAYISQLLASGIAYAEVDGELVPRVLAPLRRTLGFLKST